jgi:plasmid stabilization system protein ParE
MVVDKGFNVIISKKAKEEIDNAWDWYEDKQKGLGDRFIGELIFFIEKIQKNPFYYKERIKSFREAAFKIFPFLIIFKVNEQKRIIRIVSVFHTSRNPYRKFKA